ncbi:MAG TPA: hypothetical protein VKD28_02680 [Gemmatimonadales bacterium]|nr:hypothetical protein [Gemmatimonadales bacterium]
MAEQEPIRIVLTPEQKEQVRRLSGQIVDAIELTPGDAQPGARPLVFHWRLSAATGIPRQAWDEPKPPKP